MRQKLTAVIGIGVLCLTIASCGGSSDPTGPSADAIEACLRGAGLHTELLEESEGAVAIGAQAPDGDVIVIVEVPEDIASETNISGLLNGQIKRGLRKIGRAGVWTSSTANGGSTYIGTLGVKGVGGGLASGGTEILARQCATKPGQATKTRDAPPGVEA